MAPTTSASAIRDVAAPITGNQLFRRMRIPPVQNAQGETIEMFLLGPGPTRPVF